MTRYVLVHGAFSGAWCWEPVVEDLRARGHEVQAVDLPGSGADRTPLAEVTLDAYVQRVREALEAGAQPAVLVGHSMGGMVITQTAARYPELVQELVYVAAFLPQDGMSLVGMTELPEGAGDGVQENMVVEGEPPVATMPPEAGREVFFGECPEPVAAAAVERLGPQPLQPFLTPVDLPAGRPAAPRTYVLATRDRSIPLALQRRMASEGGARVVETDADHSPFFSRRAELLDALLAVADRVPPGQEPAPTAR